MVFPWPGILLKTEVLVPKVSKPLVLIPFLFPQLLLSSTVLQHPLCSHIGCSKRHIHPWHYPLQNPWVFPSDHKIISRLLSLDEQTIIFFPVYFSSSSLIPSKKITSVHQAVHHSPPKNSFLASLNTFGHAVPSAGSFRSFLYLSGKFQAGV